MASDVSGAAAAISSLFSSDEASFGPSPGGGAGAASGPAAAASAAAAAAPPVSLERALAFWRAFDLEQRRRLVDEQGLEIGALTDSADARRRVLLEELKAFRRAASEEQRAVAAPLLRLLQDEVDALSKRARFSEKCFLQLTKDLLHQEAADPAPALAAAADAQRVTARLREEAGRLQAEGADLREKLAMARDEGAAEAARLRRETQELEAELGQLRNQDITIRELESRIGAFEGEIEAQVGARLAQREGELRRAFEAELEAVREAETAAEGRVLALHTQLADAVAARDEAQSRLYAARARGDEELAERQAETDALAADNSRLREHQALAAAQLEDAKRRLAAADEAGVGGDAPALFASGADAVGGTGAGTAAVTLSPFHGAGSLRSQLELFRARAEAAEEECARVSQALGALQDEGRRWGEVLEGRRRLHEDAVAELQQRLAARDAAQAAVRAELAARPSLAEVAALRRSLSLLQSLHFNAQHSDSAGMSAIAGATSASSLPSSSIEGGVSSLTALEAEAAAAGGSSGNGNGSAVNGDGGSGGGGAGSGTGEPVVDVTTIMLARVRQLESRAVRAETARTDAEAACGSMQAQLEAALAEVSDQRLLILRLEDAIANSGGGGVGGNIGGGAPGTGAGEHGGDASSSSYFFEDSSSGGGGVEGAEGGAPLSLVKSPSPFSGPGLTAQSQLDSILTFGGGAGASSDGSVLVPGSPLRSTHVQQQQQQVRRTASRGSDVGAAPGLSQRFSSPLPYDGGGLGLAAGGGGDTQQSSMAAVLRAQRDRLHVRTLELETEAQARLAELAEAHSRAAKLTGDNVKMYEKIRFLQSFLQSSAGEVRIDIAADRLAVGAGSAQSGGLAVNRAELRARAVGAAAASVFGEDEFERAYRKLYAESLDPFESFARQQRQQRFQSLSPTDRIALRGGRFFLGSKPARSLFLAYALCLHLLVAATLWHFVSAKHADCSAFVAGASGLAPPGLALRP